MKIPLFTKVSGEQHYVQCAQSGVMKQSCRKTQAAAGAGGSCSDIRDVDVKEMPSSDYKRKDLGQKDRNTHYHWSVIKDLNAGKTRTVHLNGNN